MKTALTLILAAGFSMLACGAASSPTNTPSATEPKRPAWRHEEVQRFSAPDATQGVAADDQFFYAIANYSLGKYRKDTGERVAGWEGPIPVFIRMRSCSPSA